MNRKIAPELIKLRRNEITQIVKLVDFYHCYDKCYNVEKELLQGFLKKFDEGASLTYFDKHVQGDLEDRFGRKMRIDVENGLKFMYKNPETGGHEIESKYFRKERGKRLPWIRHTLENTSNIYTIIDGDDRELMYINQYEFIGQCIEETKHYWVVIVKKYKKDTISPYNFKTAFPIFKYNNLLKRLERYRPVIEFKNV